MIKSRKRSIWNWVTRDGCILAPLSLQTSGVQHLTWLVSHLPPPPHPHGLDCRSCGFKSLICSTPFPRVFIYTGKQNAFFLFFMLLSCSIRSHQDEPGRMFSHFSGNWFCSGWFCFGLFFFYCCWMHMRVQMNIFMGVSSAVHACFLGGWEKQKSNR